MRLVFEGEGLSIAVIDAGFHNLDSIELLQNINIAGMKDFVYPQSNLYYENSHGTAVLSCMATNVPNTMVGTAPELRIGCCVVRMKAQNT